MALAALSRGAAKKCGEKGAAKKCGEKGSLLIFLPRRLGGGIIPRVMPRPARVFLPGQCYHVLNRGNGRAAIFRKDADFLAFLRVLVAGIERYPVDLMCW